MGAVDVGATPTPGIQFFMGTSGCPFFIMQSNALHKGNPMHEELSENESHNGVSPENPYQEETPGSAVLNNFPDVYTWVAVYTDGSECREVEDDGTEHNFTHVDVARVRFFVLLPLRDGLRAHVLRIDSPDQRPIFLRRTSMELSPEGETLGAKRIHCLGWQKTVNGTNVKAFSWIFEDGSLLVTDNDDVA